jgi:hypothetical protein
MDVLYQILTIYHFGGIFICMSDYRLVTVVEPEKLPGGLLEVQQLAKTYKEIDDSAQQSRGLRKLFLNFRRWKAAKNIVSFASQEPRGDIDKFCEEVKSGLLEPWSSSGPERKILARIMSEDILQGKFEAGEFNHISPSIQLGDD